MEAETIQPPNCFWLSVTWGLEDKPLTTLGVTFPRMVWIKWQRHVSHTSVPIDPKHMGGFFQEQSLNHTRLLDCGFTSWFDPPVLRAQRLLAIYGRYPLSSVHTWLLWDEVTMPILVRTSWIRVSHSKRFHISFLTWFPRMDHQKPQPWSLKTRFFYHPSASPCPTPSSRSASWTLLFAPCSRARGKAPAYIYQLLSLDLLQGGLCLGLPAHTCLFWFWTKLMRCLVSCPWTGLTSLFLDHCEYPSVCCFCVCMLLCGCFQVVSD